MSVKVSSTYMAADSATDNASGGYECRDCRKLFRRDVALRRHREVSHGVLDDAEPGAGGGGRRYRCEVCRRPFAGRAALNEHLSVAHGAEPTSTRIDGLRPGGHGDGELLLVEDCCVDDEICIAADGGSAAFQTTDESDGHVTEEKSDQVSQHGGLDVGACVSRSSSDSSPADTVSVTGAALVTTPNCSNNNNNNNNNNSQTKNKNVVVHPAAAAYSHAGVRSTLGSSGIVRSVPGLTSSASSLVQVNGQATSRKLTTAAAMSSSLAAARHVSVGRAALEPTARAAASSSQRALAVEPARSPPEGEPFRGDARRPGDGPALSGFVPTTSTTQKIIVYVKTEPNHHQQIAYCAAESTTPGAGVKAGAAPCQFVCPMCGRDFASEKYLSMHVSSIHRAASDVASVIALETAAAAAPANVALRATAAGSPGQAADAPAVSPAAAAAASALVAAAQPSSTSVGGAKSHWTCNICQKAFAQNSSYKNHIRTHSDDRPYVCGICSIGFKERYHLKKHELFKHTTALNETCRICGKRFKDSTAVRAHERIHSDVRPYGCTLCGKTFKTSECLWHHENRSKTCGKMASSRGKHVAGVVTLPRQRQRRAAVSLDAQPPPLQASAVAPSPPPAFHAVDDDVKPELAELPPPGSAAECDQVEADCTPAAVESSGHEVVAEDGVGGEVVVKTEPADCDLFDVNLNMLESADTSFVDFWETFDNLDAAAVTPDYDPVIDGEFASSSDGVCSSPETTDDADSTPDETSAGVCSTSVGVKRYDCARCDKRFASAATLAKHLQVHAEVRPHRCDVCDIGFKLKVHLKKHNLYRHSEEYPCECSICGKRFKDSSAVRLHERIHSRARPFQCLHCGKSFKTRENLWGHRNRGPCEQRSVSSLLVESSSSQPTSNAATAAPQFVAGNVRLFHSAEFGPILGVPVSAKLVFRDGEASSGKVDERTATVALQQLNAGKSTATPAPVSTLLAGSGAPSSLRRVSAVRVGDTTRLAVSKIANNSAGVGVVGGGGLSLVSVPTAVVTPIKREMIDDRKLSTLVATTSASVLAAAAGNFVLPASTTIRAAAPRKRPAAELQGGAAAALAYASPHKYLAGAAPTVSDDDGAPPSSGDKFGMQRLLTARSGAATLLSPDTEQNLADALSALAGGGGADDAMLVEGDCLPPVETHWPSTADYEAELAVRDAAEDWGELMTASCDQLLTSTETDDDDDALSDAGSALSGYRRLMATSPGSLGQSDARDDDDAGPRDELESDTMWCNWAPENDLGSLLIFGP